jgi:hypothetical protein
VAEIILFFDQTFLSQSRQQGSIVARGKYNLLIGAALDRPAMKTGDSLSLPRQIMDEKTKPATKTNAPSCSGPHMGRLRILAGFANADLAQDDRLDLRPLHEVV